MGAGNATYCRLIRLALVLFLPLPQRIVCQQKPVILGSIYWNAPYFRLRQMANVAAA